MPLVKTMLKVVMLTPGTGNFFCGSCLRDHSLAKGLMKNGLDITMVPLYLPHVAEDDLKTSPLFFGGINLYLQKKFPVFNKSPQWFRHLLDHPVLLKFVSRFSGMTSAKDLGEMTLDSLEMKGPQVEFEQLLTWLSESIKPDCVILSNCLLIGFAEKLKDKLNCKVMSTLQGEDSFLDSLEEPYKSDSWTVLKEKCQFIDLFMPVSDTYGEIMQRRLELAPEKVQTVYNGLDITDLPNLNEHKPIPKIGFLANIVPGKGLMTLAHAFIELKKQEKYKVLKLMVLGSVTPFTKDHLETVKTTLKDAGVFDDCQFETNLSREDKFKFLNEATILSVPATYGESFGLYLIEALALGVPVVQPDHGAFKEILSKLEGGLLCKPDDASDLAKACSKLLDDESLRQKLSEKGRRNVLKSFTQESMAERVAGLIKENVC